MKQVDVTPVLNTPHGARALNKDFYTVYSFDDTNQSRLYDRLAQFVEELGDGPLVESVTCGFYAEKNVGHYTLLVTVCR